NSTVEKPTMQRDENLEILPRIGAPLICSSLPDEIVRASARDLAASLGSIFCTTRIYPLQFHRGKVGSRGTKQD
ncbi:unnamed protein product, partial [Nesidiocoris tenuis]